MANCTLINEDDDTTDIWLNDTLMPKQTNKQLLKKNRRDDATSFLEDFVYNDDEYEKEELPNAMEFVSVECDMLFESDCDVVSDHGFTNKNMNGGKYKNKKRNSFAKSSKKKSVFPLLYPLPIISELFRYRSVDVYKRTNREGPFVKVFASEPLVEERHDVIESEKTTDECNDDINGKRVKDQECDICGRQCSAREFAAHLEQEHMEGSLFRCEVCQKRFKNKKDLITHRILHVNVTGKPYVCSLCKERFTNKTALKNHFQHHAPGKDVPSEVCSQKFQTNPTVTQPQSSDKGFRCRHCQKSFTYKVQCISHEKLHTSDGFTKCSGSFTTKQLTLHQRKRTKEKSYQCDKCSAIFRARSSLRSHRKTHGGQKSRECPDCGLTFLKSSTLKKHRKTHHV